LVAVNLLDVGTDPTMYKVCQERMEDTGGLEGVRSRIFYGKPFGKRAKVFDLVTNAVIGAIFSPIPGVPEGAKLNSIPADGRSALDEALKVGALRRSALNAEQRTSAESELGDQLERQLRALDARPLAAYEARSLNGIWATAPYLHNGSVSSLYELLLPSSERAQKFSVGSQEFDPRFVGFKSGSGDGSFVFDTSRPGNLNTGHEGHEYGTDLSDPERGQIVEYMKTLGTDLNTLGKGPIPPTVPPSRPGSAETRDNAQVEEISADRTSLQVQSGGRMLTLEVKTPELKSLLKHFGKGDQLGSLGYEEAAGQNVLKSLVVREQRQDVTPRLLALLLSALLLWVVYLILLRGKTLDLIKGADNRYSNSKFQIVLWFSVLIITYLATVGLRMWSSHTAAFAGGVNIPQNLLLLSGLSALTFAAAKGITQGKIEAGAVTKTTAATPRFPYDLFHDDEGRVDMANFQAVIVTLLAVVVYLIRVYGFLGLIELHKSVELPDLDTTILAAFGLGQGAYLAKKYVADTGGGQPAAPTNSPNPAPPSVPPAG
jgi:hypothetical protein